MTSTREKDETDLKLRSGPDAKQQSLVMVNHLP